MQLTFSPFWKPDPPDLQGSPDLSERIVPGLSQLLVAQVSLACGSVPISTWLPCLCLSLSQVSFSYKNTSYGI